jgi:hypothetical protein
LNHFDEQNGEKPEATDVDLKQSQNLIGSVPEEQAMNGLYNMAETEAERNNANNRNIKG